ncbi:16023_t:CDS:2, partial [Gigaspora rosea]
MRLIPSCRYSDEALEKIRGQEINNKVAMESDSKKVSYGRGSDQENEGINISNPSQHKGRGRLANKRYLSAIENHDTKRIRLSYQDELLESGSKKKNKRQWLG